MHHDIRDKGWQASAEYDGKRSERRGIRKEYGYTRRQGMLRIVRTITDFEYSIRSVNLHKWVSLINE